MHKYLKYYFIISFITINELLFSQVSFNIRNTDTNESRMKIDLQNPSFIFIDSMQSNESKFAPFSKQNNISFSNTFGNKLLVQRLQQTWDGVDWNNNNKTIYFYDDFDNVIEWIYQAFNNYEPSNIDFQGREINTFDENGNLVIKIRQLKDVQDWYNISRSFYIYDVNNHLIQDSVEFWDSTGNWKPSTNTYYSYNQNYKISEILQVFTKMEIYVNVYRWLFLYNENNDLTEEKYQGWDDNKWNTYYIRNCSYDSQNHIVDEIYQDWDGARLIYSDRYMYDYDNYNNQIEMIKMSWSDSLWLNSYKQFYIYDILGNKTETKFFVWEIDCWHIAQKEFYNYNLTGFLILILRQGTIDSTDYNIHRNIYEYDLENNLISNTSQEWDNNSWQNLTRIFNIYTPKPGFDGNVNNYWLANNYPNPFNNSTTIRFLIPKEEIVTLKIFNLLGQQIETIINNEIKTVGAHEISWEASKSASGVYFYQLKAGEFIETKKMLLIK